MNSQNTGIPTIFRGIEYRSRLEARWAAMFHQLGWQYEYEPFDGNGYIPDFLVHDGNFLSDRALLIEVKPAVTNDDYQKPWSKINNGLHGHWDGDVLLVGTSPLPGSMWQSEFFSTVAGVLNYYHPGFCDDCCGAYWREYQPKVIFDDPDMVPPCLHWKWWWTEGHADYWIEHDGKIGLGQDGLMPPVGVVRPDKVWGGGTRSRIEQLWANASNEVRWRGR